MSFKRGQIVWILFPFNDASSAKMRPALIISNQRVNKTGDYILLQITTRLRGGPLSLSIEEKDYTEQPLLKRSELRLHKVFILNETLIENTITSVSDDFMKTVVEKLTKLFS